MADIPAREVGGNADARPVEWSLSKVLVLMLAIACTVEAGIILLMTVPWVQALPPAVQGLGDVTLLGIFSTPLLWFGVLRPAQNGLCGEKRRYQTVVDTVADAIFTIDEIGRIRSFNPAAERLFACRTDQAVGRPIGDYIPALRPAADGGNLAEMVASQASRPTEGRCECFGRRSDGTTFPVDLTVAEMCLDRTTLYAGIARNISDQKEVERALQQAADAAAATSRAKGQFLTNMSHEIRTPMNGILGLNSLLLETDLDPEQREIADAIDQSADELLRLVNDVLDFSKIEAGRMELEVLDFDLHRTIREIVDFLSPQAASKGLDLTCRFAERLPTRLRGDAGRLRQVLYNLIGNAIKFTPHGKVEVDVARDHSEGETTVLRLQVRDTGIGIPRDYLGRLFQSFSQADPSNTREYGGTGLGLAISKQLVTLMGGEIGAESTEGEGSLFWFTVRLETSSPTAQPEPAPDVEPFPAATRRLRILVAEDNIVDQQVTVAQLHKMGHRVCAVANGREAVEAVELISYDLILMDCHMPEMDGWTAAQEIRRCEGNAVHIPIIAVTATTHGDCHERYLAVGMDDLLLKPINGRELAAAIEQWSVPPQSAPLAESSPLIRHLRDEGHGVRLPLP